MSKQVTVEEQVMSIQPTIVKARYPFRGFDFGPRPKNLKTDPAALLIEERERERSGKKYGL